MSPRPLAVALALVCAIAATPAHARHQKPHHHHAHISARADSAVGQGCVLTNEGHQICGGAVQPPSGHARVTATYSRRQPTLPDANGNALGGIVKLSTAAGINIQVAAKFAQPIAGFISDLVARGYAPKRISCLNFSRSHVANSLHFRGLACDFDQRGWGRTAHAMYHVADLARKWGLRDGGEFRDWGHIDMGPHLSRGRVVAAARAAPFYAATAAYKQRTAGRRL